jgi:hypothetical protein
MTEFVTCAMGHKNAAGDWIVTERIDVQTFDLGLDQIVGTPSLDRRPGINLTHRQSGFYLLGPFPSMAKAREAAERLTKILPVDAWNIMAQVSRSWQRSHVKALFRRLAPEDQAWMRANGARL